MAAKFYIYCFREGEAVLYVGKGTGRRLKQQEKRFGVAGQILEYADSEEAAYRRECHWIALLMPTENKNKGGGGSYSDPNPIPIALRGQVSLAEWKRHKREADKESREIAELGTQKYAARAILRFVNNDNCEQLGVSASDLDKVRSVANG